MYFKFIFLILTLAPFAFLSAQYKIEGTVIDQKTRMPLENANVSVKSLSDTSFFAGEASSANGKFIINNLKQGDYSIEISFLGYERLKVEKLMLNADVVLDSFALPEDTDLLNTIVVEAVILRIVQNGDTTEYNAGAFKTFKGASAEDLVKKMPGFLVENGQVKQNGENIRTVTIDGKKFYGDDVTAALRNTPADIVDKVQVFEFGNDMLFLFGGEMNFGEKGLNLVTKKGMSDAYIGNLEAGYGTNARHLLKGNFNRYKDKARLAAMWNVNNINVVDVDFSSFSMRGGSGGVGRRGRNNNAAASITGGGAGITDFNSIGLAYTNEFSKKLSLTATYFLTYSENMNQTSTERTFFTSANPTAQLLYDENNTAKSFNRVHRANLSATYNIDSNNRITFAPTLNYNNNDSRNYFAGTNLFDNNDSLNSTQTNSNNLNNSLNPSAQLAYSRRFAKIGRKMEISTNGRYGAQLQTDGQRSDNFFFDTDTSINFNQLGINNTLTQSLNSVINYFEPVALGHVLQFSYNNSFALSGSDKNTNNFNPQSQTFADLDTALSNQFNNLYALHRIGLNYSYKAPEDKIVTELGLSAQYANLSNEQIFPNVFITNKPFYNLLPTAAIRYKWNKTTNMRLSYRTSTNPPQATQLQNVIDNSNPLSLTSGNSQLKQNFTHNVGFRFSRINPKTAVNFSVSSWSSLTQNYVSNNTIIAQNDTFINSETTVKLQQGAQYIFPVNVGNLYTIRNYINYSFPLKYIRSNLSFNGAFNFTQTPAIINQIINLSNNTSIDGGLNVSSNISENIDFTLSYWATYNIVRNSNKINNTNFYRHTVFANLRYTVWKGLHLTAAATNVVNLGFGKDFNQNNLMIAASLGYKFAKDQNAEFKLSVFDALAQNQSINRSTTETYWEDVQSLVLTRYFMATFTYNLRRYKTDANPKNPNNTPAGENTRSSGRKSRGE